MATTIVTKSGSGAPTASDLVAGELAVDLTNKRLYTEDSGGTVLEVGSNPYNFTANHDGSAKLATTATGIDVTGTVTADGITMPDNAVAKFGTGDDFEIYFNGTHGVIRTASASVGGNIYIQDDNNIVLGSIGGKSYLNAANNGDISFYEDTGTTPKFFWDASAESLGIGITSSLEKFTVANTSSGIVGRFTNNTNQTLDLGVISGSGAAGGVYYNNANSGYHAFQTGGTERMRIDASGKVGIGVSPSYALDVSNQGSSGVVARFTGGGAASYIYADTTTVYYGAAAGVPNCLGINNASNFLNFNTNGAERMRLDASGNLLVGTTNSSVSVDEGIKLRNGFADKGVALVSTQSTSAAEGFTMWSTGANTWRFYVGWNGKINATSNTIQAISDQRFKENIRDLDDGLSKVMELRPRKFDWKEGKGADIKDARGFIAQEFEEVFPDLVGEWKDKAPEGEEPYKAVSQDLIPTLVKAIQEQQATIEALTARIAALES